MNDVLIHELKSKFDLHLSEPEGAKYSFSAAKLVEEANMREFIECYSPLMRALDNTAVAAYFANGFSNVALAMQYSLSLFDTALDFKLENLVIHLIPSHDYCRVAYSMRQVITTHAPIGGIERAQWIHNTLTDFYSNTALPLFLRLSEVSGLSADQIWGQLPTKFNYYLDVVTLGANDDNHIKQLKEDYEYLKMNLSPDIFGLSKNPFQVQVRKIEDLVDPEKTVQMRNRCCMYYRTEGGKYCYTCPRIKEEERAARREEYREKVACE